MSIRSLHFFNMLSHFVAGLETSRSCFQRFLCLWVKYEQFMFANYSNFMVHIYIVVRFMFYFPSSLHFASCYGLVCQI